MHQPWKMFIRSVSVVTVLTAGGFAAGQGVLPFTTTSRIAKPSVEEPAPDTTPAVDPAVETDPSTTTTTTEAPKPDAPAADPVVDPAPTKPPVVDTPDDSTTTTTAKPIDITAVPAAPVEAPKPPKAPKAKPDKKKGDHNCDGHPDNGWLKKLPANHTYPQPRKGRDCVTPSAPAPVAAAGSDPAPAAAPPADEDHGRSATAPGHVDNDARPEGAPGHVNGAQNNRPTTAPGQMKKSV